MEEQKSTHKSPYSGERSGTGIDKPLIKWMDAFEKALKEQDHRTLKSIQWTH